MSYSDILSPTIPAIVLPKSKQVSVQNQALQKLQVIGQVFQQRQAIRRANSTHPNLNHRKSLAKKSIRRRSIHLLSKDKSTKSARNNFADLAKGTIVEEREFDNYSQTNSTNKLIASEMLDPSLFELQDISKSKRRVQVAEVSVLDDDLDNFSLDPPEDWVDIDTFSLPESEDSDSEDMFWHLEL